MPSPAHKAASNICKGNTLTQESSLTMPNHILNWLSLVLIGHFIAYWNHSHVILKEKQNKNMSTIRSIQGKKCVQCKYE